MLVELVDEVALNWFERLVHSVQYQVIPIWRETHVFTEATGVELDQCKRDFPVYERVFSTKLDASLLFRGKVRLSYPRLLVSNASLPVHNMRAMSFRSIG